MLIRLMEEHALEKAGITATHCISAWRDLSHDGLEAMRFEATATPPLLTRGKNKGQYNWKAADHSSRRTIYVTIDEHKAWLKRYVERTGNCTNCAGSGKQFRHWNHITGMEYVPCPRCSGSGREPSVTPADAATSASEVLRDPSNLQKRGSHE